MNCLRCGGEVIGPVWDRQHASWWRQNITCRRLTLPAVPRPTVGPSGPAGGSDAPRRLTTPKHWHPRMRARFPEDEPLVYRTNDDDLRERPQDLTVQVRNPDGTWRLATGLAPGTLYYIRIVSRRG